MQAGVVSEVQVRSTSFEALFRHASRPAGAFARELHAIGVDPDNLAAEYPMSVWERALEIAGRHLAPERSAEDAAREVGRHFGVGFLATEVGKTVSCVFPSLGIARVLDRVPRFMLLGRQGIDGTVFVEGERARRIRISGDAAKPHFLAGVLEGALRSIEPDLRVAPCPIDDVTYDLRVTW